VDTDRRLVCHIRNVDGNQTILPKPILMWMNERQHLEDEKAENRHFRIRPLPQYARSLVSEVSTRSFRIEYIFQLSWLLSKIWQKCTEFHTS